MSQIIEASREIMLPSPRVPISIRVATLADIPFIDQLQKANSKMVGWMPIAQLEGKIKAGHVLVAEERVVSCQLSVASEEGVASAVLTGNSQLTTGNSSPLGYCIGNDRYFKHDDIGIIYQMNVVPGHWRKLVGASLIKALFDRAAYGCKLYCCWCAQDIEANHFWESLGFIPLAFRSGSREKGRTHIFWQRRIREGDTTTPYWFPSQTNAGAIREDRLVLPIPPGTHWSDAKPMILPSAAERAKGLPSPRARRERVKKTQPINTITAGGLRLGPIEPAKPATRPAKQPRAKVKNDPKLIAAARELRDRYLEQFNDPRNEGLVPGGGKYQIRRAPASGAEPQIEATSAGAWMIAA